MLDKNNNTSRDTPGSPPPSPTAVKKTKSGWAEYSTKEGRKYYHNKITQVTTWDKPDELKSAAELAAGNWKEYIADSGKKYYYNTVTKESVWDEPQILKDLRNQPQDIKAPTTPPEDGKTDKKDDLYSSQEERVEAFKKLLEEYSVTATWTWDMTMRVIIHDDRYKALKTLGERKQALSEFQAEKRKQEREEKRKRDNKTRENMVQMFRECEHLTPRMPWRKAIAYFEGDLRLQALPEREREPLYD